MTSLLKTFVAEMMGDGARLSLLFSSSGVEVATGTVEPTSGLQDGRLRGVSGV